MSDELVQMKLELERRPHHGTLPMDPPGLARAWMRQLVEDLFALNGRIAPGLVFAGESTFEIADLTALATPGREALLARLFVSVDRPGHPRRFRFGELLLGEAGDLRRYVAILEWDGANGRPWRALRRVGTAVSGAGVFHGDWEEGEGALGEALAEWVDAGSSRLESLQAKETARPAEPEIRAAIAELRDPVPTEIGALAELCGRALDGDLAAGKVKGLVILAFRDRMFERWEVEGELPCGLDDFVRAVGQNASATAIAVVHPSVITLSGEALRGYTYALEMGGKRYDRSLALRRTPDGRVQGRVIAADRGDTDGSGWIGVPPSVEIGLQPLADAGEMPEA